VVDDFLQVAMLEEHMLAGAKFVGRLAELVCNIQHRSLLASVLDASIAVFRYANPEVQWPFASHRETQVGSHHHIVRGCGHLDFNCSAIERQHQWSGRCSLPCRNMQTAGRTDADSATAVERYLCCMISCRHRCVAYENRLSVCYFESASNGSVLHVNGADRLLRVYRRHSEKEEREPEDPVQIRFHSYPLFHAAKSKLTI
jgi:hypothetical protein